MKKLITLVLLLSICFTSYGQTTFFKNVTVQNTSPTLYLKGSGATINFNNSDLTLTQTLNTLTLSGGNLNLGSNNLLLYGNIGEMGIKVNKGWFFDLDIKNLPTVNYSPLKDALNLVASDVGLGNVTNESKTTMFSSPTFTTKVTLPMDVQIGPTSGGTITFAGETGSSTGTIYYNYDAGKFIINKGVYITTPQGGFISLINSTTSYGIGLAMPTLSNNINVVLPDTNGTLALTTGSTSSMTGYPTGAQPLNTKLTAIGELTNTVGYLYNDGSGNFSYSSSSGGISESTAREIVADSLNALRSGATNLNTIVSMQTDTTTLFTWNVGVGAVTDTACFRTAYNYGAFKWEGSDTLIVTKMTAVLEGTSPSVALQVAWHTTYKSASSIKLNTTAPTITSTTTGDSDTSFDNYAIPPGVWVWCYTPTVTTQPRSMRVSIIGHKRNRKY